MQKCSVELLAKLVWLRLGIVTLFFFSIYSSCKNIAKGVVFFFLRKCCKLGALPPKELTEEKKDFSCIIRLLEFGASSLHWPNSIIGILTTHNWRYFACYFIIKSPDHMVNCFFGGMTIFIKVCLDRYTDINADSNTNEWSRGTRLLTITQYIKHDVIY